MINVTFRRMDPTEALKQYAEEKLTRLQKFLDWPIDIHVVLSTEKFMHLAEVSAQTRGATFNGSERSDDMYASIDGAVDKLERQIVKYKDQVKRH